MRVGAEHYPYQIKRRRFLLKRCKKKWALCAALALLFLLTTPHSAAAGNAPIAQNITLRAYRNTPCTATFKATDRSGLGLAYELAEAPRHGTVAIEADGAHFTYTPARNRTGSDSFTYVAVDSAGGSSQPATVRITVERPDTAVTYADMGGSSACTAAIDLAEQGVFVGQCVGGEYFFEPARTVTRGEFVAMAMKAAGERAEQTGVTGFCDDAAIPTWAKGYAAGALRCGLIRGVGTAEGAAFAADEAITLGEAATVLDRLLKVTDVALADYGETDAWSAQAAANLISVSVLPSGSFSGERLSRALTRAEAAELLSAAMTLSQKKNGGLLARLLG